MYPRAGGRQWTSKPRAESSQHPTSWWRVVWRFVRRTLVVAVGVALVIIGVVMLITPGPAIVVIPVGLAMLGVRFDWLLRRARRFRVHLRRLVRRTRARRDGATPRHARRERVDSKHA